MQAELYTRLREAIAGENPAAVATVLTGDHAGDEIMLTYPDTVTGSLGDNQLTEEVIARLRTMLIDGGAGAQEIDGQRIYFEAHLPPPHLVIVGAVHIAIPLIEIGRTLGYKSTVIDARGIFATDERFPHADHLIEAWPDEGLEQVNLHPGVAAVILAHDEKFEDPAMDILLRSEVGYIGAIGSRKTSEERFVRLQAMGFTQENLDRIHGPIGLNLGGKSPEEIALSIMAEIIAVRNGRDPNKATAAAKSA